MPFRKSLYDPLHALRALSATPVLGPDGEPRLVLHQIPHDRRQEAAAILDRYRGLLRLQLEHGASVRKLLARGVLVLRDGRYRLATPPASAKQP